MLGNRLETVIYSSKVSRQQDKNLTLKTLQIIVTSV